MGKILGLLFAGKDLRQKTAGEPRNAKFVEDVGKMPSNKNVFKSISTRVRRVRHARNSTDVRPTRDGDAETIGINDCDPTIDGARANTEHGRSVDLPSLTALEAREAVVDSIRMPESASVHEQAENDIRQQGFDSTRACRIVDSDEHGDDPTCDSIVTARSSFKNENDEQMQSIQVLRKAENGRVRRRVQELEAKDAIFGFEKADVDKENSESEDGSTHSNNHEDTAPKTLREAEEEIARLEHDLSVTQHAMVLLNESNGSHETTILSLDEELFYAREEVSETNKLIDAAIVYVDENKLRLQTERKRSQALRNELIDKCEAVRLLRLSQKSHLALTSLLRTSLKVNIETLHSIVSHQDESQKKNYKALICPPGLGLKSTTKHSADVERAHDDFQKVTLANHLQELARQLYQALNLAAARTEELNDARRTIMGDKRRTVELESLLGEKDEHILGLQKENERLTGEVRNAAAMIRFMKRSTREERTRKGMGLSVVIPASGGCEGS